MLINACARPSLIPPPSVPHVPPELQRGRAESGTPSEARRSTPGRVHRHLCRLHGSTTVPADPSLPDLEVGGELSSRGCAYSTRVAQCLTDNHPPPPVPLACTCGSPHLNQHLLAWAGNTSTSEPRRPRRHRASPIPAPVVPGVGQAPSGADPRPRVSPCAHRRALAEAPSAQPGPLRVDDYPRSLAALFPAPLEACGAVAVGAAGPAGLAAMSPGAWRLAPIPHAMAPEGMWGCLGVEPGGRRCARWGSETCGVVQLPSGGGQPCGRRGTQAPSC